MCDYYINCIDIHIQKKILIINMTIYVNLKKKIFIIIRKRYVSCSVKISFNIVHK